MFMNMVTFTTLNLQLVSYSKWNSGEPNNSGDEDCVHILEDNNKWNDLSCTLTNPYICQKPQGKPD